MKSAVKVPDPVWLEESEWAALSTLLGARPSDAIALAAARVGILRLNQRLSSSGVRTFGWKALPTDAGIGYREANQRMAVWTKSGQWWQFWDALMIARAGPYVHHPRPRTRPNDPISAMIAELHRAYRFFNWRFTGNTLPASIAITLERPHSMHDRNRFGYFSVSDLPTPAGSQSHIALLPENLASVDASMECLLHEMAHLRNWQLGIADTDLRTQYHAMDFKISAELFGLTCMERDPSRGYQRTMIGPRARQAIDALKPSARVFAFAFSPGTTTAPPA